MLALPDTQFEDTESSIKLKSIECDATPTENA
jgi:hypothetical protein